MLAIIAAFVAYPAGGARWHRIWVWVGISLAIVGCHARAATRPSEPCPRAKPASEIVPPPDLYAARGILEVKLSFRTVLDAAGLRRYCYVYDGQIEAPTLRMRPGDELVLTLNNEITAPPIDLAIGSLQPTPHSHEMKVHGACGDGKLNAATTNLHFHGMHLPPACHQDEVLSTLIEPSHGFEYRFRVSPHQPPGLYWYHPHPHGYSEAQVLGGASGALIIEGMERARPAVAGLWERVLVLRDQLVPGDLDEAADGDSEKDVSLNFVPVIYPYYRPAILRVQPGQREFWRVLNAAADTFFDLEAREKLPSRGLGNPWKLQIVAIDGVPLDQSWLERSHILLAPGARAEFIVTTPPSGARAQLISRKYDAGPDGESMPSRVLAEIVASKDAKPAGRMPMAEAVGRQEVFEVAPVRHRRLYFSEDRLKGDYFITVDGAVPKPFDMKFHEPDVTVTEGTVEDWTIENRAQEAHVFHIHQLHFQVVARDGHPDSDRVWRDTVEVPYWDGKSPRYPSVTIRLDFRNPDIVGTFLFHCHILEHEDGGMMGAIRVGRSR